MKNMQLIYRILLAVIVILFTAGYVLAQKPSTKTKVNIQTNMDCESCKKKIIDYMTFEKGVTEISAEVSTKIVTIEYRNNRTTEDKLVKAIEKLGYKAEVIKEDDK